MKSESAAFLDKAREFLAKAADMMADDWPDEAGRAAYLAGLHSAQALIFERVGKVAKTHRGVQNQLERVTRNEPRFDAELHAFLGRTYNLKAIADSDRLRLPGVDRSGRARDRDRDTIYSRRRGTDRRPFVAVNYAAR